jgi:subtilisin family serine protease
LAHKKGFLLLVCKNPLTGEEARWLRNKISVFIVCSITLSLLPTLETFASEESGNTDLENYLRSNLSVSRFFAPNDIDGNKIHDDLDILITKNVRQAKLLLILDTPLQKWVLRDIQSLSLSQTERWDDFGIISGEFYLKDVHSLLQLPGVQFVESSFRMHAALLESTQQLRVRPFLWNVGYEGLSSLSTAICDTGIDDSHPDFEDRIIAWQDFVGADVDSNNDEYISYSDRNGHGTQVSSIVAGSGKASENGFSNITGSGIFGNSNEEASFYLTFALDEANSLTFDTAFYGAGAVTGKLLELVAPDTWEVLESSNTFSTNFTWSVNGVPAGSFIALFSGDVSLIGHGISVQLHSIATNYGNYSRIYQGIAPETKIVAIKVLDDHGIGDSQNFLDAFDWIKSHRDEYNISVVNLSLGFEVIASGIDRAVEILTRDFGIVVVAAAGNMGSSSDGIYSPGSAEEAITVGAVNAANEVAYYSSVGSPSKNGASIKPDILAPGGSFATSGSEAPLHSIVAADSNDGDEADNVYTDEFEGLQNDAYPDDYYQAQGTSMATPHATGIVQLLIQAISDKNEWIWSQENAFKVKMLMCMSTFEVFGQGDQGGEKYNGQSQEPGLDRTEKDYAEGWGAILADAAISAVTTSIGINESRDFEIGSGTSDRKVYITRTYVPSQGDRIGLYLEVPSEFDLDLLVFGPDPNSFGEPVIIASSVDPNSGFDETINISVAISGDYFIAVRWVNGTGLHTARLHANLDYSPVPSSNSGTNPESESSASSSDPSQIIPGLAFQVLIVMLGALAILKKRMKSMNGAGKR